MNSRMIEGFILHPSSFLFWGTRIRTWVNGSKGRCPAAGRSPTARGIILRLDGQGQCVQRAWSTHCDLLRPGTSNGVSVSWNAVFDPVMKRLEVVRMDYLGRTQRRIGPNSV